MSINPELDRLTVKHVVESVARDGRTITYGGLARLVGPSLGWKEGSGSQSFAYVLGRIQGYCLELGLPSLPVMVTDASGSPKMDGFMPCYRALHPGLQELSDEKIVAREQKDALECDGWQALYDLVGLDERAPSPRGAENSSVGRHVFNERVRVYERIVREVARNEDARRECLRKKGCRCIVCETLLEEVYGVPGIVHVHHLDPVAEIAGERSVDPERDLVPVCPNCHAVIHSSWPCLTPDQVRAIIGKPPLERY